MSQVIGICDWGIGGIGLYKSIREESDCDVVYLSDAGFTPYGKVGEDRLKLRWEKVQKFFLSQGVDRIAVACNAFSSVVKSNRFHYSIIDAGVGLIESLKLESVGVIGGVRTIESKVYENRFKSQDVNSLCVIGQSLSASVEGGILSGVELNNLIRDLFKSFAQNEVYNVLLACTHYPVLRQQILEFYPELILHDPVDHMKEIIASNYDLSSGNSSTKWFTTGDTESMRSNAELSFDVSVGNINQLSLELK